MVLRQFRYHSLMLQCIFVCLYISQNKILLKLFLLDWYSILADSYVNDNNETSGTYFKPIVICVN